MDGFKKQLNASIQRKLSFSVSLTIVVVALLAGLFSFIAAFNEAQELQDAYAPYLALSAAGTEDGWILLTRAR